MPEDKSNYWTAVMFFRAQNATFYSLPIMGNPLGFTNANGGITVYCLTNGKASQFRPSFRMTVEDLSFCTSEQIKKYPSLIYTCLETAYTRDADTTGFPTGPKTVPNRLSGHLVTRPATAATATMFSAGRATPCRVR